MCSFFLCKPRDENVIILIAKKHQGLNLPSHKSCTKPATVYNVKRLSSWLKAANENTPKKLSQERKKERQKGEISGETG